MALGELKNGIGPDAYAIYQQVLAAVVERDHPVGSLYISENATSPASFIGGTWERIEDCTIWGASDTHPAGTKLEAGLPNIEGVIESRASNTPSNSPLGAIRGTSGAFSAKANSGEAGTSPVSIPVDDRYKTDMVSFDASRSSSVYGNSDTVQPPAYCTYIWRRVA